MRPLLLLCFKQILRSRLLVLQLALAVFLQYVVLRSVGSITLSMNGMLAQLGPKQALFGVFFLQLFSSLFLAAVYGIWMIPYLHQGGRGVLTAVLPVNKWVFPAVYATVFLSLLIAQQLAVFGVYGTLYGFNQFAAAEFPWRGVMGVMGMQVLGLTTLVFFFACSSLQFGQIPTFFLSAMGFLGLQLSAAFFRTDFVQRMGVELGWVATYQKIYKCLLPVGELVFDLKDALLRHEWEKMHLAVWVIWLGLLLVFFRWKIRFPNVARSTE